MNDKLHTILDLCLALESGATHTSFEVSPHVNSVSVMVWEGYECGDETMLYRERAYYDGQLKNTKKINNIIQTLGELKNDI